MKILRKKEKRELLKKLTPFVGQAIEKVARDDLWTLVEISEVTGVPSPQLTEYRAFEKYGRAISEKHLIQLMQKKVVDKHVLINLIPQISDKEKSYLLKLHPSFY